MITIYLILCLNGVRVAWRRLDKFRELQNEFSRYIIFDDGNMIIILNSIFCQKLDEIVI